MSSSNSVVSDRALFPIMLEIAGLIGSLIGFFFSMYYINKRGLDGALDIGTYWVVDSICLPFGFAGLFFEETFQEKKNDTQSAQKNPLRSFLLSASLCLSYIMENFLLMRKWRSLFAFLSIYCFPLYLYFLS